MKLRVLIARAVRISHYTLFLCVINNFLILQGYGFVGDLPTKKWTRS